MECHMKILIMLMLIAINGFATVLTEIPEKYKSIIKLTQPKNNLITINNKLKIKGRVQKGMTVSYKGNQLKLNEKGEFNFKSTIKALGKQTVKLQFKTNKESFEIERNIIKLKNPKTIIMTQKELAFINTEFTSKKIKRQTLSNTFKRGELAYFLDQIRTKEIELNKKINNIDKIKKYSKEIQNTVDAEILSINSQGNFNSNSEVTLLFLLTGISRAMEYQTGDTVYPELAKYKNKWFYETLTIALDKKIIKTKELNRINQPLSNARFIKYSSRIPELKSTILAELNFNYQAIPTPKITIAKKAIDIKPKVKSEVKINKVYQLSKTTKEIHGNIKPARSFSVNWKKVTPDKDGSFTLKIPSKQTKLRINFGNDLLVTTLPKSNEKAPMIAKIEPKIIEKKPAEIIKTTKKSPKIQPYTDIKKHWISKIANQLKLEGKLSNTENFNPKKEVTRADLAKYIVKINGLSANKKSTVSFNDLNTKNPNYTFIQNVVSNKLLNGISSTQFAPNKKVTKLQAIIVASRLLPDSDSYKDIQLPYNDIKKYKWATGNLKKAYYYKIISKSSNLNPNKSVSKAELISILYKTSKI
ncbi:hypothetical protein DID73_01640 [Candidatus Marinamargulisbacteria bacterium SCGC AG-343-K17]|nr:hypothetical protein DID73_01640 [Candidatus Marinamargulisbacteria bacterium SCGC AG-343-K17]